MGQSALLCVHVCPVCPSSVCRPQDHCLLVRWIPSLSRISPSSSFCCPLHACTSHGEGQGEARKNRCLCPRNKTSCPVSPSLFCCVRPLCVVTAKTTPGPWSHKGHRKRKSVQTRFHLSWSFLFPPSPCPPFSTKDLPGRPPTLVHSTALIFSPSFLLSLSSPCAVARRPSSSVEVNCSPAVTFLPCRSPIPIMIQLSILSLVHTATLVLYVLLSVISKAQSAAPVAVVAPQYATVNQTLYVQGGSLTPITTVNGASSNATQQFYSLDLTKPWNDQSPPWKALSISSGTHSSPPISQQSMAITSDTNFLIIWDALHNAITTYDIRNNFWSNMVNLPATNPKWSGFKALVDPASVAVGTVYVPE